MALLQVLVGAVAAAAALNPPTLAPPPGNNAVRPPPTGIPSPLIAQIEEAALECLAVENAEGRDRDLSWMVASERAALEKTLFGLRGRKLAWWLDAPRPLRALAAKGPRHDISVVALPGGTRLPPASYPEGSLILVEPLLGQFDVRRIRGDQELMRKTLRAADSCMDLAGGCLYEWQGAPGVASALLQVVLLPPNARFPSESVAVSGDGGSGEMQGAVDSACGGAIGVAVSDLVRLERPAPGSLGASGSGGKLEGAAMPDDAPELLRRLASKVGGLDGPISVIVRRALASRLYPRALTKELGVAPVRGMLLYGPPGCGKTLLAREICSALGAREPKIVNGPEMMSKYVGDSEEFIRALFADAELEQAEAGDASLLHVIVFDELDAFTRERGSLSGDTSGIRDSVVNQLLAKMDGVDQIENVLIIGLTNRPELIDAALLRPGRLEVQVEVPRPDVGGRQQIIEIQTGQLQARGCLEPRAAAAICGGALATVTSGFSGADLAGLVRSATSYALERYVDEALLQGWEPGAARPAAGSAAAQDDASGLLEVAYEDLVRALREASPRPRYARRPMVGVKGEQGADRDLNQRVRGWWRETRLRVLTDTVIAAAQESV